MKSAGLAATRCGAILSSMSQPFYSIDEARQKAARRQPKMIFDFIDGAAGAERAKEKNRNALNEIELQPRVLVQVEHRSLRKRFLGRDWGVPFGIAPMGMCDLAWPGTDRAFAAAARTHNLPVALSTAGSTSIETFATWASEQGWFQLYVGQSKGLALELVDRALAAGYQTLIFTVDVPQVAPRLRDLRNGFRVPFRIGPKQFIDFATHPRWSIGSLLAGSPRLANFAADKGDKAFKRNEGRGLVDFSFLKQLRDRWPHQLIVKGVLHPEDAGQIQAAGADGIYVSNHGGRQLSSAPPAIKRLPLIRQVVGPDYPLIFDSGIRSGEDVIKALALGADFVMLGRPFLYAAGAAGPQGVETLVNVLSNDISVTLAQIGRTSVEGIGCGVLVG